MIIMLCGQCQMDMFLHTQRYYDEHGNRYSIKYILIDENNHMSEIKSSIKEYDPESAEARLIRSLIEHTNNIESIS